MMSTARVTPNALLGSLTTDQAWLAATDPRDLGSSVPGCPDWNVEQLLAHLGIVHRFAMRGLSTPPDGDIGHGDERPPVGEDVIGWVVDGLGRLVSQLAERDLDVPCWSFFGPSTGHFWLRRQAHETAIHRWDAESASATPHPIDPEVAADGIAETLWMQPLRGYRPPEGVRGTVHLHATDGDGEWLITLADDLTAQDGHHKGDAAIRGTREQLDLLLWNRIPPTRVDVVGDLGLVERFLDSM